MYRPLQVGSSVKYWFAWKAQGLSLEQIKKLQKNGTVEHEISIFWVPRRTLLSNKILEEEGILGDVDISEFPLYFLPLEDDLLSLELQDSFTELFLVSLKVYHGPI